MGNRELVALLNLSSWCLVMVERHILAVLWGCLRFVIVIFPDHTHLLFLVSFSGGAHAISHSYIFLVIASVSAPLTYFSQENESKGNVS